MAVLYSIRGWNDHFEVSQSRKVEGPLSWLALPCKHDGKSFRRLMLLPDGAAIYGAWVLIAQVAAKCPKRGVLADADGPLDASDLAIKTGCPQSLFERALQVLSDKKIGWLHGVPANNYPTELAVSDSEPNYSDEPQLRDELVAVYERSGSTLPTQTEQTIQDKQDTLCGEDATARANGIPDGSEDGEQATSEATGKATGAPEYPAAFESFWEAYPTRGGRKRGKGKCYGIWRQAIRAAERQSLVEAARSYAASDDATRGFAKDPERFLVKDFWRDWLEPAVAAPTKPVVQTSTVPTRIEKVTAW